MISPYPTVGSRIGERADDLQLLNNGSRTPVRDDNRQSVELVFRNVGVEGSDLTMRCKGRCQLAQLRAASRWSPFLSVELFFDVTVCVYPGMARPTPSKRPASTSATQADDHRIDLD